jgi:putative ABC transport system permease protein
MLGRNILPEEDQPGREREMILSYGLWTRRFNRDPHVIGRSVQVNGHDCRIIGVMPSGFDFPLRLATPVRTPSAHMEFWAPFGADPAKVDRSKAGYAGIARLREGVSLSQARQDLAAIGATLARHYPRTNEGRSLHAAFLRDRTLGMAQTGLGLLMATTLLFVLIGCANVANLLLARALARHREIAVRLALGAARIDPMAALRQD